MIITKFRADFLGGGYHEAESLEILQTELLAFNLDYVPDVTQVSEEVLEGGYSPQKFILNNSIYPDTLLLVNFKDTNICEAKKLPTVKGELRVVEYYMDSERLPDFTINYLSKAIVETNSWEYLTDNSTTPPKKLPLRRTTRLEYLLEDGSIGHTIETYKNYDQTFLADILEALQKRHQNIIAEVALYLSQLFDFTKVAEFNKLFASEISAYISGSGMVLVEAINNSLDPDLTPEIKANIIYILSY